MREPAVLVSGLDVKVAKLRDVLHEMESVVVCFSGGVDSSYLLAEAVGTLGDSALALTAAEPATSLSKPTSWTIPVMQRIRSTAATFARPSCTARRSKKPPA
jgi:PP-loop superfamily ATP-utilizing enzyme